MNRPDEYQIGNIEIRTGNDIRFYKHGLHVVIRSKNGQGWGLPLVDIEPQDLRHLADLMEKVEDDLKNKDDLIVKKEYFITTIKNLGKQIRIIETRGGVSNTYVCDFDYINWQKWFKENNNLDQSFIDQFNSKNYANIETDDLTITAICI